MTDTISPLAGHNVPQPIARALRRLIHRVRGVILLRGVSAVVATAIGALLLVMAIDAGFTLFSETFRWVLTLSALAVTVAVAMWLLILPIAKTITLTGIARAIETRHPELQERLSSAVELLTSRDIPEIRGSETLIAALAAEASQDAGRVRPRTEVPLKAARPYLLAALSVLVVFGSLWALYPSITSRLLKRAVAPFMNLPNIKGDMLTVTPGDAILAEGQRLEIGVEVASKAVKRASLRKRLPDGSERSAYMTSLPPSEQGYPRFTITCPPAAEDFTYRVHAGDALSMDYSVTVVPPAIVKRLDAHYVYPAYTRRAPETETDIPGDIRAVAGTKVTVSATTNKPVKSADVQINGRPAKDLTTQILPGPGGTTVCKFQFELAPRMRGRWALAMTDQYGFKNTSPERQIVALADKPPTVKIINPDVKRLRLKPSDRLPVQFSMSDDFGLAKAEFVVATDARKGAKVAVSLPDGRDAANRTAAGEAPLLLSKLPLRGAKQFTFRLRAADNRPPDLKGPGEASSRTITVELDLSAESYAMQSLKSEEEAIRKGLEKVLHELKKTKEDSVPVKEQVAKAEELTKGLAERVDRMREHLAEAKAATAEVTPKAAEGTFAGLEPKLEKLEAEVAGAEDKTGQVKLADTAAQRGTAAAEADQHVDKAIGLTEELLKGLDKMAEAVQLAQALTDMAAEEAALAAQAAQQEVPGDWQRDQEQLAGNVGELVADTPAAQQAQLARDQQAAQDMAADARQLQKEQLALAEETGQLAEVAKVDQALENLAAEQAQLAKEAGAEPVAADQQQPMAQAAEDIRAAQLPQAIEQQKAAEQALAARAEGKQPGGEQAGGEQAGGEQAGGEQAGGEQAGGEQAGGEQAGGEQAGGEQAGGEQAGGEQAGGEQAGGEQAGGEQAGGEQAGGEQAGGEQAGGEQAGGEQAGGEQAGGEQPSQEAMQKAGELAAKQQDIRERTEELLAQRNALGQEMTESQMARLQAEQAQLAREATELAENVAPMGGQPSQLGEQAAHDAQAAAQQLPTDIGAAAESASSAAEELGGLSDNLGSQAAQQAGGEPSSGEPSSGEPSSGEPSSGEPSSGEPSSGEPSSGEPSSGQPSSGQPSSGQPSAGEAAQMAQQAGDLAERQEQLAAEMQALAQQSPQQALAAAQEGLADRTGALQEAAAALGERAEAMAPATAAAAGEATEALGEAQQFAEQAAGELGQGSQPSPSGSPEAAQSSQQSAAEALGEAAEALSGLGQALAQAAEGMPAPSAGEAAMGQPMAEGYSAATEAAASQSAPSAAQAAQALSQAASQAAAMAQAMGAQPGMGMGMAMQPGMMPAQTRNSRFGIGPIGISLTAAKLQGLGIKLSDWARLPGELRNQILQAAEEGGPEEYRALIKRYFQKVAKKGGQKGEESK